MNVERVLKVADVIQANPDHFDMTWWMAERSKQALSVTGMWEAELIVGADLFACGTSACLAGWTVSLWGAEVDPTESIPANADRILGLTHSATLFDPDNKDFATADKAAAHLRRMASDYEADHA